MWRVFVALVVAGGVYSAQAGVGYWYDGFEWRLSNRPPLTPVWHAVGSVRVREICGGSHFQFVACEVYRVAQGECHVYALVGEGEVAEWQRWHAYLHCAGWDHG